MSIKILTLDEAHHTERLAAKYNEACFVQTGLALADYYCDNSGKQIPIGSVCAAVVLLPSESHPNYQHQVNMLGEYIA